MAIVQPDLSRQHFLLVDDHPFLRSLIQSQLVGLGAKQFFHAANGRQALEVLEKHGHYISFIISDWNMSPMSGLGLPRLIRMGDVPDVPPDTRFLMLTGYADRAIVNTAARLDVNGFLVKPVPVTKLAFAIETALSKSAAIRGRKFYEAVPDVDLPGFSKVPLAVAAPWVLWIAKSKKRELQDRLRRVQCEGEKLHAASKDATSKIKDVHRASIAEVKPGAVLAEDVCDADGRVLIRAGVILENIVLCRLAAIAADTGQDVFLWVGNRALEQTIGRA